MIAGRSGAARRASARSRASSSAKANGFVRIVVGAGVEPADAVREPVARGQHEDRRPDPRRAQPATDLEPVDPRQHDVEDDRVVVGRVRSRERVLAGDGNVHRVRLLGQPTAQQGGELHLVLDDQEAHAFHCGRGDECPMRTALIVSSRAPVTVAAHRPLTRREHR